MKLFLKIICTILTITLIVISVIWYNNRIEIKYEKNGTYEDNVVISFKHRIFNFKNELWCKVTGENYEIKEQMKDNRCTLSIPEGSYNFNIEYNNSKLFLSGTKKITIKKIEDFEIEQDRIYLIVGEKETINYTTLSNSITWEYDENIISFENNIITGLKDGKTTLIGKNDDGVTDSIEITVTSLLNKQTSFDFKKSYIGCKQYSNEEAKMLDEFLEYKINKAGYQTRAGVVEAARFLTLSFQYRIPYFFENGRLFWSGVHYIDGEGRYYHKGLYLSEDKYSDIGPVMDGPSMWGCNLTNRDGSDGYVLFAPYPNGLDCSGFVTWALLNGGFDIGDVGANDLPLLDDSRYYSDVFIPVTMDTLNSGKAKPGDIIAVSGHTALIVGIDEEHFYVAESTVSSKGVVVNTYTKPELIKSFTYIHLMDEIYKEDGNLTMMW